MPRSVRCAIALAACSLAVACHRDAAEPKPPGITVLAGTGIVDTVDAPFPQGLTIEVRDDAGELRPGVIVRFEAQAPDVPSRRTEAAVHVCTADSPTGCGQTAGPFALDTTDDRGRAHVIGRFGQVATRAVVRIHVPELGLVDSVEFRVEPGNAVRVRAGVMDTAIVVGVPAVLPPGHVVDRYDNTRPGTTTHSLFVAQNLAFDPVTRTVTGQDIGTSFIRVESGTLQPDVVMIRVLPPGRLVVWSSLLREVRLVNTDGTDTRVIATSITSGLGVFPRFDATRRFVTMLDETGPFSGTPQIVVTDTAETPRVVTPASFEAIVTARQLADETLIVVATLSPSNDAEYGVWRVGRDNVATQVATLPGLGQAFSTRSGAADVSPDGTRVAYLAATNGNLELRVVTLATGATTVLAPNARSPRWSPNGDRVAYLELANQVVSLNGRLTVINADGTGKHAVGSATNFNPGICWSSDGVYVLGRLLLGLMRIVRVSDGAEVSVTFPDGGVSFHDYLQPDWR
jgi:hypothetical protein